MEKSVKSISINQGILLGAILSIFSVLVYMLNLDLFTEWWFGILLFIIILVFGIIATSKTRSALGGFMSFKQAFTPYFITIAVGTLISTVVGIVIFALVDPDAAQYLNEKIIEMTVQTMESFGSPQDAIDETVSKMEGTNNFSVGMQTQSYFVRRVIFSVIGLIVALAFKKKDPNAA